MNGTQSFLPASSTHKLRGKLDENNHVQIEAMTSCEAFGLHNGDSSYVCAYIQLLLLLPVVETYV
jgi:hypothetical protein